MQVDTSSSTIDTGGGDMFSNNINIHGGVSHSGTGNLTFASYYPQSPTANVPKFPPAPRCPLASANFVGRTQELDHMSRFFFGDDVRSDQIRVLAVIGMGGCGKTQLVRKFMEHVYRMFKLKPWLVFYVDATTITTLEVSLAAIAKANGYASSSDAALAWASSLGEPFFVYIDNADDPTMNLRDYFPKSPHARIVITTRLRETKQRYTTGPDSAIFLGPLSDFEAIDLLTRTADLGRTSPGSVREDVAELIQELKQLPLAVVQAGAVISQVQWSVRDYLERFRKMRTSFMDGKRDRVSSSSLDDYPFHVYTTWKLSYSRLSATTAKLMGLCAHLHHARINEGMFQRAYQGLSVKTSFDLRKPAIAFGPEECSALQFLDSFALGSAPEWSEDDFRRCIQEACSSSILSYDNATSSYSVHPLVHDWLRSVAPHPAQTALILSATLAPIWEDQVASSTLVPHVQQVLAHWNDWRTSDPPLHPSLALNMAQILYHAGRWDETEVLQRAALAILAAELLVAEEKQGSDTLRREVIAASASLASTLKRLGRYEEAEKVEAKVLDWRRGVFGADHPDTVRASCNLAWTLHRLGRYSEAETIHKEVLEWRRRKLGQHHVETLRAMSNVALTLNELGQYDEANQLHREVLERRLKIYGTDHIESMRAMGNAAFTLARLGRYHEAEKMQNDVLLWRRRVIGIDHPDTIRAWSNLGITIVELGRYQEAENIGKEVLEKRRCLLGMDHPDTMLALANLASTLKRLERYEEARQMETEVLEWRRRAFGVDHPDTIRALAKLGWTISHSGQHAEAEHIERQALESCIQSLGDNHPDTLTMQVNLQWTLDRLRDPRESMPTVDPSSPRRRSTDASHDTSQLSSLHVSPSPSVAPVLTSNETPHEQQTATFVTPTISSPTGASPITKDSDATVKLTQRPRPKTLLSRFFSPFQQGLHRSNS